MADACDLCWSGRHDECQGCECRGCEFRRQMTPPMAAYIDATTPSNTDSRGVQQ